MSDAAAPRQHCAAKTRRGADCRNPVVLEDGYCIAHSTDEQRLSRGFGGVQEHQPGRPSRMAVWREQVEAEFADWIAPFYAVRDGATLFSTSNGRVQVSDQPDLGARMLAAEKVLDRVYGRPKQVSEVSGLDGGAITLVELARRAVSDE